MTGEDRFEWAVRLPDGDADLGFGAAEHAARRLVVEAGGVLLCRRWRETGDGQTWVGDWTEVKP